MHINTNNKTHILNTALNNKTPLKPGFKKAIHKQDSRAIASRLANPHTGTPELPEDISSLSGQELDALLDAASGFNHAGHTGNPEEATGTEETQARDGFGIYFDVHAKVDGKFSERYGDTSNRGSSAAYTVENIAPIAQEVVGELDPEEAGLLYGALTQYGEPTGQEKAIADAAKERMEAADEEAPKEPLEIARIGPTEEEPGSDSGPHSRPTRAAAA